MLENSSEGAENWDLAPFPDVLVTIDRIIAQSNSLEEIDQLLELKRKALLLENLPRQATRIMVAAYILFSVSLIMLFLNLGFKSVYLTLMGIFLLVVSVNKLLDYQWEKILEKSVNFLKNIHDQ